MVPGSIPVITFLIYSAHLHVQVALTEYSPVNVGGSGLSIIATVSDAIVSSWPQSTATVSYPLGYLVPLLQVVDN